MPSPPRLQPWHLVRRQSDPREVGSARHDNQSRQAARLTAEHAHAIDSRQTAARGGEGNRGPRRVPRTAEVMLTAELSRGCVPIHGLRQCLCSSVMLIYRANRCRCGTQNDTLVLDQLRGAYKAAVEEWIAAIKQEEALASVDHSVAEVDQWERAHFREDEIRSKVKAAKKRYEDALREKFLASEREQRARSC
jgi:hypothetical protein